MKARASDIIVSTAKFYGLRPADLIGRSRSKNIAHARVICMAALRRATKMSSEQIGIAMGDRDHSTVLQNIDALAGRSETEPEIEQHIAYVVSDACELAMPQTGGELEWDYAGGDWFATSKRGAGQWLIVIEFDGFFAVKQATYAPGGKASWRRESLASAKRLAQQQEYRLALPAMERRSA